MIISNPIGRSKIFISFFLVFLSNLLYSQDKVKFWKGCYYTKAGYQINGFLAFKPNARRIVLYAPNEHAQPERIKARRLSGFVIDKDSFAIISDFFVEGVYQDRIWARKPDVAKVLEVGSVNLYLCHYIESTTEMIGHSSNSTFHRRDYSIIPVYVLRRKDSPLLQSVPESQASFNKVMSKYFEDDPNLAEEIANGKYANRTTPELVRRFNNNTQ